MWICYRVSFSEELINNSWITSEKCWLLARSDLYVHFNKKWDLRCEMRCSQRKKSPKIIISNSNCLHPLQEARSLLTFRDFKTHLYLLRGKHGTLLCSQNPCTVGYWVTSVFCSLPKGTTAVQRRKNLSTILYGGLLDPSGTHILTWRRDPWMFVFKSDPVKMV